MTPNLPTQHEHDAGEQVFSFDLGRYMRALRRYVWLVLALIAAAVTAAVFYTRQLPEIFEATASVQIEPRVADLLGQGHEIVSIGAGNASAEYYKQQKQVLSSVKLLRETVIAKNAQTRFLSESERASLTLDQQYDLAAHRLRNHVVIKYPEQNRIMYVVVSNSDPKLAMDIANAHIATYDQYSRGLLSTGTQQASTALSAEFIASEKALREAEAAIYEFQRKNDLLAVSLEDRQNLVSGKIMSYSAKADAAHSRSKELASRLEILRQIANGGDVVESPLLTMGNSTAFDAMRAQYYTEQHAFEELRKEMGPKSLEYSKAKARIDNLRQTLESEAKRVVGAAEKEYQAAVKFERDMAAEVERHKKDALELVERVGVDYNTLARAKKSAEDKYNILVGRLSQSEMTGRLSKGMDTNVRPLDSAVLPTSPVSPSLRVNIMVAASLALVLGLGFVFLVVFLDRSIKSAEDAQISAGAPVLGIVPLLGEDPRDKNDRGRDLFVHEHPKSQVAESCRALRTNIVFSGADRPMKTIVVTSANPREGKTTMVMYLGTTMAQSGERVLLVDTDMRRPRLHVSMQVSRGIGLSNLIVGDGSYEDAIKSSDVPNLFVLPCGPLPPNPAELLMTQRFAGVLEELGKRFDRIILDSPPLGAVTDAAILSRQTDGVALVVHAGKTLRDELKRSVRQIRHINGSVIGVILNQLDTHGGRYGYYKYYGYGETKNEPASAS